MQKTATTIHLVPVGVRAQTGKIPQGRAADQALHPTAFFAIRAPGISLCHATAAITSTPISAISTRHLVGGTNPDDAGMTAMTTHLDVLADAAPIGKTLLALGVGLVLRPIAMGVVAS
jgi:hypothetical protein